MKWRTFSKILFLVLFFGCTPNNPTITSIDPLAGYEGAVVTIEGTGFGTAQWLNQILFSGIPAGKALSWSEALIEVAVPEGAQTGEVWIVSGSNESNRLPFIIASRPPLEVVPVVRSFDLGDGCHVRDADVGDFNEDGLPDLALANPWMLSMLVADDDPFTWTRTDFELDDDCFVVVADDFNDDDHLDVVGGTIEGMIHFHPGDGEGGYGASVPTATSFWGFHSMTSADFNEDGFVDLIGSYEIMSSAKVAVLFGDGLGRFGNFLEIDVGYQPVGVTTNDFDGDGHMDVAVTNSGYIIGEEDTVSILFGDGLGGFSAHVEYDVGDTPKDIASADFNNDGAPDLAVANYYSIFVSVLLNDGLGGFAEHHTYPIDDTENVTAGDFNGDGIVDLSFGAAYGYGVYILLGYGDGTFLQWDFILDCCNIEDLVQGDFTGDGILDLVTGNGHAGSVALLTGDGSGRFGQVGNYSGPGEMNMIVTGDFNEDGHKDIAAAGEYQVSLYFGDGEGGFSEPTYFLEGWEAASLVVGDWNDDDHLDLAVVRDYSEYMQILLGDGLGGFGESQEYQLPSSYHFRKSIDTDDFNEDGLADLVVCARQISMISLFLGDGFGGFVHVGEYEAGYRPMSIACGDFNEDGHTDLAVSQLTAYPDDINDVSILYGDGEGGFSAPVSFPSEGNFIITEDIDLDGHLDLILTYMDDPVYELYFQVLKGNGDGTFEESVMYFGAGTVLSIDDFDEDGLPDVAGVDWDLSLFYLSLGDGLGGFDHHADFVAVATPLYVTTDDFNEDGHADAAVANGTRSISIFLGNGLGGFVEFND